MSLTEWQEFVFAAGHLDDPDPIAHWRKQSEDQQVVADRLARLEQLRIVGPDTDLTVNVAGRPWLNAHGRENFPDGEVYTSPIHTATEGTIAFSFPSAYGGKRVEGVRLWFEQRAGGQGSRRPRPGAPGERAGHRRGCAGSWARSRSASTTRSRWPPGETLFDEKIGGTCHMALGMAFPEAGGTNPSGVHWDMVCDLRRQSQVFGDGELIFENGRFL